MTKNPIVTAAVSILALGLGLALGAAPALAAKMDAIIGMQLEPPNLDPTAGAAAAIDEVVYANVFEGLTRFGADGSILPALAVSLVIAGTLGLSLVSVLIALTAVHWTEYARVVRNMTVVERAKPYVMAAQAMGAPGRVIMFRHLLPNVGGPLLVLGAYSMSWVILAFAGLSFLGLGVEPGTAEWGRMVAEARSHMRAYPRLVLAPGLSIMALVIVVNLLGDALADRWRVDQVLARSFRKGRPA